MVQWRELLSKLLEVAEFIRAFISHLLDGGEELYLRLKQSETDLAAVPKVIAEKAEAPKKVEEERETFRIELEGMRKREKTLRAKLKEAK